jgi:hypothetical protein
LEDRQNPVKKATPSKEANAGPAGLQGSTVDGQRSLDGQKSKAAMRATLAAGKVQIPAYFCTTHMVDFEGFVGLKVRPSLAQICTA